MLNFLLFSDNKKMIGHISCGVCGANYRMTSNCKNHSNLI